MNLTHELVSEGAIFVFLDVPEGTEFGIDLKVWNTGEKFRGVKMIPPGIHFIHYSEVDRQGGVAPKVGFFYNFHKSEFVVRHWNKDVQVSNAEVVGLKDNITALDHFLGPYPRDTLKKWTTLSNCITEHLINKLTPISGEIRAALDLQSCSDANRPRKSKSDSSDESSSEETKIRRSRSTEDMENELLPDLKPFPGTQIQFSTFADKPYPNGCTPSEITQHSLDSTYSLEILLDQHIRETDLIGELQFAYICFLVGHSLDAFEHWKKLVVIFCSCQSAISKHRNIYDLFVSSVEAQIVETPEEFLADIVTNNNIVYLKLRDFFRNVKDSSVDGRLKAKVDRLRKSLTTLYGWDFSHLDSEDEEDAPVVVEM